MRRLFHLTGRLKKPILAPWDLPVKDKWEDKAGEDGQEWHEKYALDVIRPQHDRNFNASAFLLFIEVCHLNLALFCQLCSAAVPMMI